MESGRRIVSWARPAGGLALIGALAAIPALSGCADVASAADGNLERFTGCAELNTFARRQALRQLDERASQSVVYAEALRSASGAAADSAGATAPSSAQAAGVDFSTTNVQEAGIDEPDVVKTDGTRIFAIARNQVFAVDPRGGAPRIAGRIALPANTMPRDLLLSGNRLLVMADRQATVPPGASDVPIPMEGDRTMVAPQYMLGGTALIDIDVSNPSAMSIREVLATDAQYVTARMSGSTARIVLSAPAPTGGITYHYPAEPGDDAAKAALAANRRALSRTTADNWLPHYTVSRGGVDSPSKPLVQCDAVSRPATFSGLGTVNVLTVDLTAGVEPIDTDTVMASAQHVMGSAQKLYIATARAPEFDANGMPLGVTSTDIHVFDTSSPSQTGYLGSGAVGGTLLNQFAMSEHEGRLRVATTTDSSFLVGGDAVVPGGGQSESAVTVMEMSGEKLVQIGSVGGLGKGERIFAVRFIGSTGYVVTFKQTDPLYTIDLADPRNPRVTGELKINGYSAYLHPVGDGLILGVGQDADDGGRVSGLQVSLFDVADPGAPKRLQRWTVPGAGSDAEWDHHAFLWWPAASLAVLPLQQYGIVAPAASGTPGDAIEALPRATTGSVALRVGRDAITEVGRITPPDPSIVTGNRRSLVIGDTLYTVGDGGIAANSVTDLADRGWAAFS